MSKESLIQAFKNLPRGHRPLPLHSLQSLREGLSPSELGEAKAIYDLYQHERDCGRHGDVSKVTDHFGLDEKLTARIVDSLATDELTLGLMARRGTDASHPLPEITRRDIIEAAIGE